jgi:hypothetical protein
MRRKHIYEVLTKLNYKSTNFMLLMLSVHIGSRKGFAYDNGTRGKYV